MYSSNIDEKTGSSAVGARARLSWRWCRAALCGVAGMVSLAGLAQSEELNIYNWGGYINPEILKKFEASSGIKVTLETYVSNEEMLAKVQGSSGYDIVFPSVWMQDIMARLDLLEKTDIDKYEGFKNIDASFLRAKSDPKGEYCLPYAWGSVGILFNRELIGKDIKGWRDLSATMKEKHLKFTLLDDMREVMAVGLILNGKPINSTEPADLEAAARTIIEMKPDVGEFIYDPSPAVQKGEFAAGHIFSGVMIDVFREPAKLGFVIPEEGATMYEEDMCVLKAAPHKESAIKFLQFYTRPDIAALNVAQQANGTANKTARFLLPRHVQNSIVVNPPPATMARLQMFVDLGGDIGKLQRAWETIKAGK